MNVNETSELLPCPFCGGEAFVNDDPTGNGGKPHMSGNVGLGRLWSVECDVCGADAGFWQDRNVAIAAWNNRTPIEYDGWFYLPKPKEGIVDYREPEITKTENGYKVRHISVVADEALRRWSEELGEQVMKRICKIWNSRAEQTCKVESKIFIESEYVPCPYYEYEMECGGQFRWDDPEPPNHCPNCGAKVVSI